MNPWTQVIGWTLVHFVWQGGLITLATAVGLQLFRRRTAEVRYAIGCAGLAAMLASSVMTATFFWAPGGSALVAGGNVVSVAPESETTRTAPPTELNQVSSSMNTTTPIRVTRIRLDAWLPFVVWGWLSGVTFLFVRFAGGCWRVHRVRVASVAEPVSRWQLVSERLAAQLRLGMAFRVVDSTVVQAPTVLGWIRPVILLPIAALTNLAPAQIEAVLAHELAHIRRRDYVINLVQTVAETLLFYHPGIWWVSARIRAEREHCCDDVAVEVCGEPTVYAAALAELASWQTGQIALAVAATDGILLARVRRLLRVPGADPPSIGGLVIVTVGLVLTAGVAVQWPLTTHTTLIARNAGSPASGFEVESNALPEEPPLQRLSTRSSMANSSSAATEPAPAQPPSAAEWRTYTTDHFEIQHPPDLDLHAERVGREAERAYERVSADLKHNLPSRVPVILFHTTDELEQSVQAGTVGEPHVATFTGPVRMLLAMDHPADQWYGLITHEVSHVFLFDIVPGRATPRWIHEGLAEYERGEWDPSDLVTLREVVRANAIPRMSGLNGDGRSTNARFVYALGHAVFDFMESRWGKAGVRQFIFWLRQTATKGGDPYERALQVTPDEFDQAFERYLSERVAASVGQSQTERSDERAILRIEGEITAIHSPVPLGLACIELWVVNQGGVRQRWAVECGDGTELEFLRILRPGDRVIVTGPQARTGATQRILMESLVRQSEGFTAMLRPAQGAASPSLTVKAANVALQNSLQDRVIGADQARALAARVQASDFPVVINDQVLERINRLVGTPAGREFIQSALQRMPDYRAAIERRLAERGMPESLVAVALVESGFRNDDGLPTEPTLAPAMRGAGIWMFVPETARRYGLSVQPSRGIDERLDVARETDAAITYLGYLHRRFGDWHLALAAYHQGESQVARAIDETGSRDPFALAKQGHLNDYLATVMAGVVILANPEIVW